MIKRLFIAAAALLFSVMAAAAPNLLSNYAPATGGQPDSASVTINGGAPVTCPLEAATDGTKRLKCDLASVVTPGTYTLVATWCSKGGITNTASGAVNTIAGCASSAPFSYKLQTADVPGPTLSVSP